jgi:hypothetical protein
MIGLAPRPRFTRPNTSSRLRDLLAFALLARVVLAAARRLRR